MTILLKMARGTGDTGGNRGYVTRCIGRLDGRSATRGGDVSTDRNDQSPIPGNGGIGNRRAGRRAERAKHTALHSRTYRGANKVHCAAFTGEDHHSDLAFGAMSQSVPRWRDGRGEHHVIDRQHKSLECRPFEGKLRDVHIGPNILPSLEVQPWPALGRDTTEHLSGASRLKFHRKIFCRETL